MAEVRGTRPDGMGGDGPGALFVTGMLRSGTTLLDKLLHAHPQLTVASQPFFGFYTTVKGAYLGPASGRPFPLTPGFMERPPSDEPFASWLGRKVLEGELLEEIERDCTAAKGQSSPSLKKRINKLRPDVFFGVWRQLHHGVAEAYGPQPVGGYVGSKEVLCEEFVPHLASCGARCILSVRDPRAVIASLNRGRYRQSVGDTYPILLNIRNWRKSVAHLLWGRHRSRVLGLRYEDLASDGQRMLQQVAQFLGVQPFDPVWYAAGMKDQEGRPWQGNSSFEHKNSLDAGSLEQWRKELDPDTVRLIEFCTYPELRALGYPVGADAWDPEILRHYQEDPAQIRQDYAADYGLTPANLEGERQRREVLLAEAPADTMARRTLFLFDEAYAALREALGRHG